MGRKLTDMTGRKIGSLTVISYAGNELWNCKCDCGNVVKRYGSQLRRTQFSNCGCKSAEISRKNGSTKKIDLIGKRFGRLTVTELAKIENGKEYFNCECDCGGTVSASRKYLISGLKTHCGCCNKKDITGERFGRLTVFAFDRIGKDGKALWKCRCDCGNEKVASGVLLRNGSVASCGCLKAIATRKANKKYNKYTIDGDVVRVKMTNSDDVMLCDIDDWNRLSGYCWSVSNGYATTNSVGKEIHRTFHMNVIDCPDGMLRDHINRNRLDNRKSNLRIVSREVNARNTSLSKNNTTGYKGVTYSREYGKYTAQISVGGKNYRLGCFNTAQEAYAARLEGEKKYFGEIYSEEMI